MRGDLLSRFCSRAARPSAVVVTLMVLTSALSGCWLAAADQRMRGKEVTAEYLGLENKSVAIVIFTDQALVNEFPDARAEISGFLANQMRSSLPTTRLLAPKDVIAWQDETINWFGLSESDIGQHFGVDRVLMIELLNYSTTSRGGVGDLQGNIRATAKIFEVDKLSQLPAWRGVFDVSWPKDGPVDVARTNESVVRQRTLEMFASRVTGRLFTHREMDKPIRTRE